MYLKFIYFFSQVVWVYIVLFTGEKESFHGRTSRPGVVGCAACDVEPRRHFHFQHVVFFLFGHQLVQNIFFFVCCCLLLLSLLCAMLSACYCTNPPLVWIFSIVLFPMIRLETEYENLMAQPPHRIPYILLTSHHYHLSHCLPSH